MDFDTAYASSDAYFGALPERSLVRHAGSLDPSLPILDLGCGQGRNALWLAKRGLSVEAVDPSPVAMEAVERVARSEGLAIRTIPGSFQNLDVPPGRYGGILVFGLIPILSRGDIEDLAERIGRWAAPGCRAWLTAFTTADPAYPDLSRRWSRIGRSSFQSPEGTLRTFLEPGELRRLLPAWRTLHWWEGPGPEHRHGGGPPERHGLAELVAIKPRTPQ